MIWLELGWGLDAWGFEHPYLTTLFDKAVWFDHTTWMVNYVFVAFLTTMVSMDADIVLVFFIDSILNYISASILIKPYAFFVLESLCIFMAFMQCATILIEVYS